MAGGHRKKVWPIIPIGPILEHYGADLPGGAYGDRWVKVRCPFHDDRQASATVNIELGKFKCFACEAAGSAPALVKYQEGGTFRDAARKAEQIAGVEGQHRSGGRRSEPATDLW